MSEGKMALLVIDVQESFRHAPYWQENCVAPFLENIQRLIDGAVARNIPVVQIFHVDEDHAFRRESGFVKTMEPVRISPDKIIEKHRHSAFVGTELESWLRAQRIERLIICGIRSEQCCETTTRHGSDLSFEIDYVSEATLTFDMEDLQGAVLTAAQIIHRTETVLAGRFATIKTVEQVLAV